MTAGGKLSLRQQLRQRSTMTLRIRPGLLPRNFILCNRPASVSRPATWSKNGLNEGKRGTYRGLCPTLTYHSVDLGRVGRSEDYKRKRLWNPVQDATTAFNGSADQSGNVDEKGHAGSCRSRRILNGTRQFRWIEDSEMTIKGLLA